MSKLLSTFVYTGTVIALSAETALAWTRPVRGNGSVRGGGNGVHSVPEVDASAGLLAIAAVLAILAFVWERNRRAAV